MLFAFNRENHGRIDRTSFSFRFENALRSLISNTTDAIDRDNFSFHYEDTLCSSLKKLICRIDHTRTFPIILTICTYIFNFNTKRISNLLLQRDATIIE